MTDSSQMLFRQYCEDAESETPFRTKAFIWVRGTAACALAIYFLGWFWGGLVFLLLSFVFSSLRAGQPGSELSDSDELRG
jgi:hypothetical protein